MQLPGKRKGRSSGRSCSMSETWLKFSGSSPATVDCELLSYMRRHFQREVSLMDLSATEQGKGHRPSGIVIHPSSSETSLCFPAGAGVLESEGGTAGEAAAAEASTCPLLAAAPSCSAAAETR